MSLTISTRAAPDQRLIKIIEAYEELKAKNKKLEAEKKELEDEINDEKELNILRSAYPHLSFERYKGADCFASGKHDFDTKPSNTPVSEVGVYAIENNCPFILKNGDGQYYVKCMNMSYDKVKEHLDDGYKYKYRNCKAILIKKKA